MEEPRKSKGMSVPVWYKGEDFIGKKVAKLREYISKWQLHYDIALNAYEEGSKKEQDLAYFSTKKLVHEKRLEKWVNHISQKP